MKSYTQEVKQDWGLLVNQITQLAKTEDKTVLTIGDTFLQIKKEYGNGMVREAALESGVSLSVARQRSWVANKIPKNHFLRATHLSYGHLRTIAGTKDVSFWGQECLKHGWTIKELKIAIEEAEDKVVKQGAPCFHCGNPLSEDNVSIAFTVSGEKRARVCSFGCAGAYFINRQLNRVEGAV